VGGPGFAVRFSRQGTWRSCRHVIVPDLRKHLARHGQPEADGLVFTSPDGRQLRQSNFRRRVWAPALADVGLRGVRFHDLRHTGDTLTAGAGANLRELMERMGAQQRPGRDDLPARDRRTAAHDR
jgi:integrase